MQLHFYTLWAINAALDESRLRRQLDQMKSWGFDGAVFHPRFYPNVPPYLSDDYLAILSRTILHAKSIGLDFWLYDENGWPSGTVGGELLRKYPGDAQQWADLVREKPADLICSFEHGKDRWYLARRIGAGVDYLNPEMTSHFLAMTYERYRTGLDPQAFEHVSHFFSDEPEFGLGHAYDSLSPHGAIPWTPRLPELCQRRYGRDLHGDLPLLFFGGDGSADARIRFWELCTDAFNDAFTQPIDRWCRRHGKRFTAHVKGEEHPLFQVPTTGSCSQLFQHLALPGIDALERYPSGHFFPRQVASAAQQFGNGDCMVEAFGGAGWGAEPEDLQRYLHWLVRHGLNHIVLHLFQYHLSTHAIRDWPPSLPIHMTWRDAFPQLLREVRAFAQTVDRHAQTLLIAPHRGIMGVYEPREFPQTNVHNASTYPATAAAKLNTDFLQLLVRVHNSGIGYHVTDERTVDEQGRFERGILRIGRCEYSNVIVAPGAQLGEASLRTIDSLTGKSNDTRASIEPPPAMRTIELPIRWRLAEQVVNQLILEAQRTSGHAFIARFDSAPGIEISIAAFDELASLALNDEPLAPGQTVRTRAGSNEVKFHFSASKLAPFLAIRGIFAVCSATSFNPGPNRTRRTEGPFRIEAPASPDPRDLLASGYPFCGDALGFCGEINLPAHAARLQFPDIHAACAHVCIGGAEPRRCWWLEWMVTLSDSIRPGAHLIEIRLVPSTFNTFGPHHHIDGDRHIVSPAQYEYVKNFADRRDAPASTRSASWHLKPLGLGGSVRIWLRE